MQIHVESQPKYACACEDPSETCVNRRENMISKRALRHFDDVGSLLYVLGCPLGSIFSLEENAVFWAWYSQNTAKFHHTCHKMGSNRGVIGPIWRIKWCGWCGKPFGIISEHNFFLEKIHFLPPPPNFFEVRRHANSYRGPSQNLGVSYLEIYVELRDLPPRTFFSYVMVPSIQIHSQMGPIERFTLVSRYPKYWLNGSCNDSL